MKSVERRPDRDGREAWLQTLADGSALEIVVAEESAPERLVTEIVPEPGAAFGGRWIYRLEATPRGTAVLVTEDGWIDNKFFRFVSRIMGYHGSLDSYLGALAAKFGEAAPPEHVPPS